MGCSWDFIDFERIFSGIFLGFHGIRMGFSLDFMGFNGIFPSDVCWFINPYGHYSYLRIINHSEIGVICTNLAIVWGPHIVGYY